MNALTVPIRVEPVVRVIFMSPLISATPVKKSKSPATSIAAPVSENELESSNTKEEALSVVLP